MSLIVWGFVSTTLHINSRPSLSPMKIQGLTIWFLKCCWKTGSFDQLSLLAENSRVLDCSYRSASVDPRFIVRSTSTPKPEWGYIYHCISEWFERAEFDFLGWKATKLTGLLQHVPHAYVVFSMTLTVFLSSAGPVCFGKPSHPPECPEKSP